MPVLLMPPLDIRMKAVSLWQPWASAIALGQKRFETRSWATLYRGPLAIHAAKRPMDDVARAITAGDPLFKDLPFGAIVAVSELVNVYNTESVRPTLLSTELSWGDYRDRRYAWELRRIRMLVKPIPWRGAQGLFEVPDNLFGRVHAA